MCRDVLPVGDEFEVVGNIGNGTRWGLETEISAPLDMLGLDGARLDVSGRWQRIFGE